MAVSENIKSMRKKISNEDNDNYANYKEGENMSLGVDLKDKCKFKKVCTSICCDECDCLYCTTICEWGNDKCPKDDDYIAFLYDV